MKRQIILRGLLGFPLGIAIGNIISVAISFGWGVRFMRWHFRHCFAGCSEQRLEYVP